MVIAMGARAAHDSWSVRPGAIDDALRLQDPERGAAEVPEDEREHEMHVQIRIANSLEDMTGQRPTLVQLRCGAGAIVGLRDDDRR